MKCITMLMVYMEVVSAPAIQYVDEIVSQKTRLVQHVHLFSQG
jgi:hypothetical protein